ncbi:hypothetical protein C942_02335 [Photobacterium marinum]|uniref:Uncharacterized protein n=1 Tax=Photobacterium marinum TaxID=1056511 RepID=L8JAN3_9GAMM|nr:hypothetical protein [Photobacterium marinum]ELR64522.1 hypothetical protein C942_02335 [Photobacterium marinum]
MKNSNYGVILPSHISYEPISEEAFKASCYLLLMDIERLVAWAFGESHGTSVHFTPDREEEWIGSEEQQVKLFASEFWKTMNPVYAYAERGEQGNMMHDDTLGYLVQVLPAVFGIREYNGEVDWVCETLIYKALARLKLDTGRDLDEDEVEVELVTYCSGWLPLAHHKHLTLQEMAILAGAKNIRSIRNATYDKKNPLRVIKENRNVLVTVEEAKRWLAQKSKFIPSPC